MRTKLVVASILWCCMPAICFGGKEDYAMGFLHSAPDKDAILAWGKQQRNSCRFFEFSHNQNKVIVLLVDRGSGVCLDHIYIYGKSISQKEWHLVLFRPTDTQVEVQEKDQKLVFRTITGDVILEQSLDAIGPFGEMVRKKVEEAKKKEGTGSSEFGGRSSGDAIHNSR